MKVKLLRSGEIAEFHDSYAARLIEQGRAICVPEEPPIMPPPEIKAEEIKEPVKAEKPEPKKKQKG